MREGGDRVRGCVQIFLVLQQVSVTIGKDESAYQLTKQAVTVLDICMFMG